MLQNIFSSPGRFSKTLQDWFILNDIIASFFKKYVTVLFQLLMLNQPEEFLEKCPVRPQEWTVAETFEG